MSLLGQFLKYKLRIYTYSMCHLISNMVTDDSDSVFIKTFLPVVGYIVTHPIFFVMSVLLCDKLIISGYVNN